MNVLDQIRARDKKADTPVDIEEWGVTLYVRSMTAGEWMRVMDMVKADPLKAELEMVRLTVVDADGQPVFSSSDDVTGLSPGPVGRLHRVCLEANGIGQGAAKKPDSGATQPD